MVNTYLYVTREKCFSLLYTLAMNKSNGLWYRRVRTGGKQVDGTSSGMGERIHDLTGSLYISTPPPPVYVIEAALPLVLEVCYTTIGLPFTLLR